MNYYTITILGIFVISIFSASSLANAETGAKSTSFEKTTLIEFTNNESTSIHSVKLWLGKDSGAFKSFKAEKGWTGTKTPQGVLVFTTTDDLSPGQSVKFGIKTEVVSPGINWRTIDSTGVEISTGKTLPGQASPTQDNTQSPKDTQQPDNTKTQS